MRFLVASGPTQEPLDPVRFLSNDSTGVMGRCLAGAARERGHRVFWVRCPEKARTALDLRRVLRRLSPKCDVLVMAAAVCDARPRRVSQGKIKKERLTRIELVRNPDILAGLSKHKRKGQVFVGFAIESEKLLEGARRKLKEKGLDLIAVQKAGRGVSPFGERTVESLVLERGGAAKRFDSVSKRRLARFLIRRAEKIWREKRA